MIVETGKPETYQWILGVEFDHFLEFRGGCERDSVMDPFTYLNALQEKIHVGNSYGWNMRVIPDLRGIERGETGHTPEMQLTE